MSKNRSFYSCCHHIFITRWLVNTVMQSPSNMYLFDIDPWDLSESSLSGLSLKIANSFQIQNHTYSESLGSFLAQLVALQVFAFTSRFFDSSVRDIHHSTMYKYVNSSILNYKTVLKARIKISVSKNA